MIRDILNDEDRWVDNGKHHYLKQFSVITDEEQMLHHLDRALNPDDKANLLKTLKRVGIAGVFKKVHLTDLVESKIVTELRFQIIISKETDIDYAICNFFDFTCDEELTSQEQAIVTSAVKRFEYGLF